jgi:hypothetical protein
MVKKRRKSEGFNLAFLDIMSCGLGAVVLVFMLVKHNVDNMPIEADLLAADVRRLELQQQELQKNLSTLTNISQTEAEKVVQLRAKLASLEQALSGKELSLEQKRVQLAALKKDISEREIARKEDLVEDDRGGEENYLMGLKVEGRRIAVLLDSSGSMTDEALLDIIKRKNGSAAQKKIGPKWLRARKTVRWLLARAPKSSEITVLSYNASVKKLAEKGWIRIDNPATLQTLYRELDNLVPEGATNLQKGLQAVNELGATDLYLITDGLPTVGESSYASLNPFASCSSLLGKSSTISGECRVKLFRQTIKDSSPKGLKVNVILMPIEGDPDAVNEYWAWAAQSGGLVISPAVNWP